MPEKLINGLEIVLNQFLKDKNKEITSEEILSVLQENMVLYDKNGEQHYDMISAFIKSIRGSDPNAAVYWLARMLAGGEDIKFIARRMLISASEDIGLANPNALTVATQCFQAVNVIGNPEARIILSECAVYLAVSPKSKFFLFSYKWGFVLCKENRKSARASASAQCTYQTDERYELRQKTTNTPMITKKVS